MSARGAGSKRSGREEWWLRGVFRTDLATKDRESARRCFDEPG